MKTRKKGYIRKTEELLKNYNQIKLFIENTEKKMKDLTEDKCSFPALSYDERVQTSCKTGSDVENDVIRIEEAREELQKQLDDNIDTVIRIEKAMSNLTEEQKMIINYYYFKKYSWFKILELMHYSDKTLRERKKEAVRAVAYGLFGICVYRENEPTLFDKIV